MEEGKIVKEEIIRARKKQSSDPLLDIGMTSHTYWVYYAYDKDSELNGETRFVIIHNRPNPKRAFMLVNQKDAQKFLIKSFLSQEALDFLNKSQK